jgi:hypothetical protein
MPTFDVPKATVRYPARPAVLVGLMMLEPVAGFLSFACGMRQPFLSYLSVLAIVEAVALLVLATAFPRLVWGYARAPRDVRATPQGLYVGNRLAIAHAAIANVSLRAHSGTETVVIVAGHRALDNVEIYVQSASDANGLAEALQGTLRSFAVGAAPLIGGRARRHLLRALVAAPVLILFAVLVTTKLRAVVPVGYVPLLVGYAAFIARPPRPAKVTIGADGVALLTNGYRFVSYGLVRACESAANGVSLELTNGERLTLEVFGVDANVEAQGEALARAVRDAWTRYEGRARDPAIEHVVERARRNPSDWIRALRAIADRSMPSYRDLALSNDRLLAVVESPAAESSARIGAAIVALAAKGSERDDMRRRIRVAGTMSAAPGVGAVLEALADDERDEVMLDYLERSAS